jgi:CBS domain-containing protein
VPASTVNESIREIEPLHADDLVGAAAQRVIAADLPALPAVEADGSFAGIFGERELIKALFPGYVGELGSSAMISRSIDDAIERRVSCAAEPIRRYLTTDHVLVEDDFSDTQLAELFIHYRVLVIPIATERLVHAVITRSDFFRVLAARLTDAAPETAGG